MTLSIVVNFFIFGFIFNGCYGVEKNREKGLYLGQFENAIHDVGGKVWALDDKTLYVEGFTYDGVGPDAFFWVGNSTQPKPYGQLVRYPLTASYGMKALPLPPVRGENLILHLPPNTRVSDLTYLSVWCRRFTMNFGHVIFPLVKELPRKMVLKEFQRISHGVRSGNVTILDARTFYIPNLHYDGLGPDAFFWVGKGSTPDHHGSKIPNEKGSFEVLKRYVGEDIEIQLPENKTVYDIEYLSIWCVQYRHNFGHVQIPNSDTMWLPPSLGQIRIKDEEIARIYSVDVTYEEDEQNEEELQNLPQDGTNHKNQYLPVDQKPHPEPEPGSYAIGLYPSIIIINSILLFTYLLN